MMKGMKRTKGENDNDGMNKGGEYYDDKTKNKKNDDKDDDER